MDQDDDVERLFSWLQTPDLHYREFAGAREVTDTVATWQISRNTANEPAPPAAPEAEIAEPPVAVAPALPLRRAPTNPLRREPATIAPEPRRPIAPVAAGAATMPERGVFALDAGGRGAALKPVLPLTAPGVSPIASRSLPSATASGAGLNQAAATQPATPAAVAPPRGGGLLGGAYRGDGDGGADAAPPGDPRKRDTRSLDAVFSRLAGRGQAPDPRERLRHIPGLGPSTGRPR